MNAKRSCPAHDCKAAGPAQRPAGDQLQAAGVTEDWVNQAQRCSYCGCVWVWSVNRLRKTIKGWLDSGHGWVPKNVPRANG